jgi:hypothetical protein
MDKAAAERLRRACPNAIMIHTPVHASWLNQIPVNRDLLLDHPEESRLASDFASLAQLSKTLLAFIDRYNQTAGPFKWKYTAADLAGLLRRISEHDLAAAAHQADLSPAA